MAEIFKKVTTNGKHVSICAQATDLGPMLRVYIDGKYVRDDTRVTLISPALRRHGRYPEHITHVVANVGLTPNEAQVVEAAFAPLREAWERRPEVVLAHLRDERRSLELSLAGAVEAFRDCVDDCFNNEHGAANVRTFRERGRADVAKARAALAAWDREHPEVIAHIEAERKTDVERHIWD